MLIGLLSGLLGSWIINHASGTLNNGAAHAILITPIHPTWSFINGLLLTPIHLLFR
jgi:hypothetical protein